MWQIKNITHKASLRNNLSKLKIEFLSTHHYVIERMSEIFVYMTT